MTLTDADREAARAMPDVTLDTMAAVTVRAAVAAPRLLAALEECEADCRAMARALTVLDDNGLLVAHALDGVDFPGVLAVAEKWSKP